MYASMVSLSRSSTGPMHAPPSGQLWPLTVGRSWIDRVTRKRAGRHVLHEVREDGHDLRELSWILPDLGKVPEHGFVSRHVGEVALPALVLRRQRPHDVVRACRNRSLFRVKALAGRQREVIGLRWVEVGVEVREQGRSVEQRIQVRHVRVADDVRVVLILERHDDDVSEATGIGGAQRVHRHIVEDAFRVLVIRPIFPRRYRVSSAKPNELNVRP